MRRALLSTVSILAPSVALVAAGGCGPTAPAAAPPEVAAALEQHTVDSDGHPMAVWEKSPTVPSATMLLLHGRTWSTVPDFDLQVDGEELSLMDGLVDADIAAFGLDARGYGATPRDDTGWLTPDRAAGDVIRVLEWLGAQNPGAPAPVLFGWSYGSMVSQLVVQRRPDLVSGVILFGYPFTPGTQIEPQATPDAPPAVATTAEAATSDFIVEGAISQRAIDAYVEASLAADPVRVDWRALEEWNELDPSAVTVPTLLIEGEFDPLTDTDAHEALFTGLGTSDRTWTVVPGGAHAAFLEAPRPIFLESVTSFALRVGAR